jgi:hypothetical protein
MWTYASVSRVFGAIFLFFGGMSVFHGAMRGLRARRHRRQLGALFPHWPEIVERGARGETPDQVAEVFERRHNVPSSTTLRFLAQRILDSAAQSRDPDGVKSWLAWLSSTRDHQRASAREMIRGFDGRRNVMGVDLDVHTIGNAGAHGALIATRSYLYFFRLEYESWAEGTARAFASSPIPGADYFDLAKSAIGEMRSEFTAINNPARLKDLEEAFESPGSFAVPWREVASVDKQWETGLGGALAETSRVALVVRHGAAAEQTERMFRFGFGLDDDAVDSWTNLVRQTCALDGKLLPGGDA